MDLAENPLTPALIATCTAILVLVITIANAGRIARAAKADAQRAETRKVLSRLLADGREWLIVCDSIAQDLISKTSYEAASAAFLATANHPINDRNMTLRTQFRQSIIEATLLLDDTPLQALLAECRAHLAGNNPIVHAINAYNDYPNNHPAGIAQVRASTDALGQTLNKIEEHALTLIRTKN